MWKMFLILGMMLIGTTSGRAQQRLETEVQPYWGMKVTAEFLDAFVMRIEAVECEKLDHELYAEGLNEKDIERVRGFCRTERHAKLGHFRQLFERLERLPTIPDKGTVVSEDNSYTCYWQGFNYGIPNYADLGVSSSSCTWHDSNASCQVEGSIGCLWGCTNSDPSLGWHTKWFASRAALETAIFPAYRRNSLGTYTRAISHGYRWEVQAQGVDSNGRGNWHSEGPEPNYEFTWYAFLRDWWPAEAIWWHARC